ncbi:MAG TPA: urease accessory protein UreD [Nitrososphaera sp.]|nr:urease accessory protein UreD [Nitrososphaera sp.]
MTLLVPTQFEKYGDFTGANGRAVIEMEFDNSTSKTAIRHQEVAAPLLVQRALYPDAKIPGMAHVYVMSSAGGVLQGDRLLVRVEAGGRTMARITTQSATKLYRMDKGYAVQEVEISANESSYLEFFPKQLIPYRSSRFLQDVTIRTAPGSTVLYSETLSTGRNASGERFDFDACFLRVRGIDSADKLLFADSCNILPAIQGKRALGRLFGEQDNWSTLYVISGKDAIGRMSQGVNALVRQSGMFAASSLLPDDCGLVVRILDDSIDRIEWLLSTLAGFVRKEVMQAKIA